MRHDAYGQRGPGNAAGIVVAVAMHAAAIGFLLQYEPTRRAIGDAMPIMVNLITPVAEKPQEPPKPLPVKPRVVEKKPFEPAPVLTAPAEAPAPYVAPPPPPASEPIAAPAPVTLPVVPPDFNAAYLRNPPPAYPYQARRLGQQGKVVLHVLVNTAGLPDKVELRASSGTGSLDEAALDAVRNWRFVPAKQGDKPVAAWVLVPIVFSLSR
jgi:protein TonB